MPGMHLMRSHCTACVGYAERERLKLDLALTAVCGLMDVEQHASILQYMAGEGKLTSW